MIDYRENAIWSVYVHIVPKEISDYDYDKYYVGITSWKPEIRWGKSGYKYLHSDSIFRYAILKYGWDNIQHEVIAEHLTEKEAKDIEVKLISKLDSFGIHGYNLTLGGDTDGGRSIVIYKFDLYGNYIEKYNSITEAKKKNDIHSSILNASNEKRYCEDGYYVRSQDVWNINGKYKIVGFNEWKKPTYIYQFDLFGKYINKYNTVMDIFQNVDTGISSYATLYNHINHHEAKEFYKLKYIFRKEQDVNFEDGVPKIKNFKPNNRMVFQFDRDGNFIKYYDSRYDALKENNISKQSIECHLFHRVQNIKDPRIKYLYRLLKDVQESEETPGSFIMLR